MQALKSLKAGHWLLLALLPLSSLFFVGGPDGISSATERYIWNLGHVAFFFLFTVAYAVVRPIKSTMQAFSYLAGLLVASLVIEFTQRVLGREFSTVDILRNLIGGMIALFFVARPYLHISVLSFLSFIFAIDLLGFASTVWTDQQIQKRSPVIANFESEFIAARWGGEIETTTTHALNGNFSGKATFPPGKYPAVYLESMLKDWSTHSAFEMNIYNPEELTLTASIRIHDYTHQMSTVQAYEDRFNYAFTIQPGWNQIKIDLDDIRHAPKARQINLEEMYQLALFFSDLEETRILYLDDWQLTY